MLDALAQGCSSSEVHPRCAFLSGVSILRRCDWKVPAGTRVRTVGHALVDWRGVGGFVDGTLRSCFRRGELCAGEGGVPVVFVCCMLTGGSVECAHSVGGVASPGAAHDRCGCVS